jgi:TPR repeat protein
MRSCRRFNRCGLRAMTFAVMLGSVFAQAASAQSAPAAPREAAAAQPPASAPVATKQKEGGARPKPQVIDVDAAADPERAWALFRETARFDASYAAYEVLNDIAYTHQNVDADACARHREALATSIRAVPISIALRRAAMLCASALKDEATADRELAALAALSKHALSERGESELEYPIRVFQLWDIYSLVASLGYEFRYEFFGDLTPKRYFRHIVAAWDPEKKIERHFTFDYVDTIAAIDRESELFGYPYHRNDLADAYIQSLLNSDETIGFDMDAVKKSSSTNDVREKARLLRAAAERGGIQSVMAWILLCGSKPFSGCADGLVDALLPQAEKGHAVPMTMLAIAYRNGIGLKKDKAAAEKLLANANARWYQKAANLNYIVMLRQMDNERWPEESDRLLGAAVDAGNRDAEFLLLIRKMLENQKRPLDAQEVALLAGKERDRSGRRLSLLASHYQETGRNEQAMIVMRQAAEAGDANAQSEYAQHLLKDRSDPQRVTKAEALLVSAAHGGHAPSMRYLAWRSMQKSEWAAAVNWLLAAVEAGDIEATLALAAVFEVEHPGVNGKPKDAFDIYSEISEQYDSAEARRRMALMTAQGIGTKKDLAKAKAMLLADAEKGDLDAQVTLGDGLLNGTLGAPDIAGGEAWMKKAISAGSENATFAYGTWLIKYASDAASRAQGRKLLAEGKGADQMSARNNLAWALCVSPHADVREPAAGLVVAKKMETDIDELDPGTIDTIAACYAANSDFTRAVALQEKVIAALPKNAEGKPEGNSGLFRRLQMYKARQAYIEVSSEENRE